VPLLSGFWSKDQILDTLYEAAEHHHRNAAGYWFVFGVALVTAFLTAFYTFRAYCLTFLGSERVPPEAGDHAHESPWVMLLPLVVLAVGAVFAGLVVEPFGHQFSGFLAKTPTVHLANALAGYGGEPPHAHFSLVTAGIGGVIALAGVAAAVAVYGKGGPEEVPESVREVYALSRSKLFVDEVYYAAVVWPAEYLAAAGRQFDLFLDALARLVAFLPRFAGAVLRPLQNGLVQFYALGMVLGLAVFLTVIVVRSTR
jgi:NADH-quinone oxidoreductase subunit L